MCPALWGPTEILPPQESKGSSVIIILWNCLLERWYIIEVSVLVFVVERPAPAISKSLMGRNEFFKILPNTLFLKYFLILAALGLSCGTQNLRSSLRYTGSLVAAWELCVVYGINFPEQRLNLGPLHWEHRVLTTEPPGRSLLLLLLLLLSLFSRVWLCVTPKTAVHQAPLSAGFSRQEYWSGLPFPSPREVPSIYFIFMEV